MSRHGAGLGVLAVCGERQHSSFAARLRLTPPLYTLLLHRTTKWFELEGTLKGHVVPPPALNRDTYSSIRCPEPHRLTLGVCRDGASLSGQPMSVPHHPYWKNLLPHIRSDFLLQAVSACTKGCRGAHALCVGRSCTWVGAARWPGSGQSLPLPRLSLQVLKPGCCTTEMQSSLGSHCSIQRIISCFTDRLPGALVLPGHPGEQGLSPDCPAVPRVLQVLLSPDVPYQTLAGFVESSRALHRSSPGHYERLVCLLLLQLCTGLEHLRVQNARQGDICPENLLLVQCPCPPGSQQDKEVAVGLSLPRLLISNFFKMKDKTRPCSTSQEWDWTKGSAALPTPMADELNVGMLIYKILHVDISLENALDLRSNQLPAVPSLSIYSTGLKHLATLLLHRDPCKRVSIKEARHILQVLLWGPRQELFAKSKKTLALLQSWLEMKRALLLLKLAEKAAGGGPGLEEWLCCQYFVEATKHTLYQVTQTLYMP